MFGDLFSYRSCCRHILAITPPSDMPGIHHVCVCLCVIHGALRVTLSKREVEILASAHSTGYFPYQYINTCLVLISQANYILELFLH